MFDFGGGFIFAFFPLMFGLVFLLILGTIIFNIIGGLRTWKKNNDSPRLNVRCKIVDKRQDFRSHRHHNHANNHHTTSHTHTSTSYYVTFEVESGDRIELLVPSSEYGLFVEGDTGNLEFQGTRFLGFVRER